MIPVLLLGLAAQVAPDVAQERIAFVELTGDHWQVCTAAPDGSDQRQVTQGAGDKRQPCWTHDGRQLLFTDTEGRLFRVPSTGGEAQQILAAQVPIAEPHLSASDRLAFLRVRQEPGYLVEVWTTDLAGSDARLLTHQPLRQLQPAWSPDGRQIAVAQFDPQPNVYSVTVLAADGSVATPWFAGPYRASSPSWSPDGRAIVFALDIEGNNDLWLAHSSGEPTRLTQEPGVDMSPVFSPDGTEILFVSRRSGSLQLWRMPASGGAPARVTRGEAPCREPAWWAPPAHASLQVAAVAFSRNVLDARAEKAVDVSFQINEPARARAELRDLAGTRVSVVESPDVLERGTHSLHLPIAPDSGGAPSSGVHLVRVVAWNSAGETAWDPARESGGRDVSVQGLQLDDAARRFDFRVPALAVVRVRAGLREGPLLATPLDWTPMAPGAAHVAFNGTLPQGWGDYWDLPDRHVWVAAYSLPDNAILVEHGEAEVAWSSAKKSLHEGSARELFMHARHAPSACRDPLVHAQLRDVALTTLDGVPIVADRAALRIDAHDEADRALLETSRFEVMVFVDGQFLMEDEDSALPFHFTLDVSSFPEGRHAFLVNIGGYQDHLGATFVPFEVRRGER